MTTKNKYKLYLLIAIIFISVGVFIFADGLRRCYSGGFFLIIGGVTLYKALFEYRK